MRVLAVSTAIAALAFAASLAAPAAAADYPVLRGSQIEETAPPPDLFSDSSGTWSGFYIGGFAGYGDTNFKPGNSVAGLIGNYLRNTTIESEMQVSTMLNIPDFSQRRAVFGGFGGYNFQFGDVVLGIEGDYARLDVSGSGSDAISRFRQLSDGYIATASVTGNVAARAEQLGTLRLRAGYTMGQFMPFVTGGLAYGTARVTSSATVQTRYVDADPTAAPVLPTINNAIANLSLDRKNASMLGGVIGAGVDVLIGGLLLRGEVLHARMEAQGNVVVEHTAARVGAGVKF
jgi:hypothetical protein